MGRHVKPYPPELRERAVRMVAEVRPSYPSQWAAIVAVKDKLGIGTAETLRHWVRQAEIDAGNRPGMSTEQAEEMARLKREVAELRRANEILKAVSVFSRPSSTGPRDGDRLHRRAQGLHRGRAAVGCRAHVRRAGRARHRDLPVDVLRVGRQDPDRSPTAR